MSYAGKSKLYAQDLIYIQRKMNEVQEHSLAYAAGGFKAEGWNDAFYLRTRLIDLRQAIDSVLKRGEVVVETGNPMPVPNLPGSGGFQDANGKLVYVGSKVMYADDDNYKSRLFIVTDITQDGDVQISHGELIVNTKWRFVYLAP